MFFSPYIDPLKVMRNPATLQAYRQHQRALWAAGQPWFSIGLAAMALEFSVLLFALFRGTFGDRNLLLIFSLLMFASGLCFLFAGVRVRLYRRSHPLVLPETSSRFGQAGNVG